MTSTTQPTPTTAGVTEARGLQPVQRIDMVSYDTGYSEPAGQMWRVEVSGYCADFATEIAANNFHRAVAALTAPPGDGVAEMAVACEGKDMAAKAYHQNWREAEAALAEMRVELDRAKTSADTWKESHGRVVEGFAEVCEAVGVQFDAPEAVAYAINAKISNAEHDKRAAEAELARENSENKTTFLDITVAMLQAAVERDQAIADLARARKALEPFKEIAKTEIREDENDSTKIPVRIGFVRAAAAAVRSLGPLLDGKS